MLLLNNLLKLGYYMKMNKCITILIIVHMNEQYNYQVYISLDNIKEDLLNETSHFENDTIYIRMVSMLITWTLILRLITNTR